MELAPARARRMSDTSQDGGSGGAALPGIGALPRKASAASWSSPTGRFPAASDPRRPGAASGRALPGVASIRRIAVAESPEPASRPSSSGAGLKRPSLVRELVSRRASASRIEAEEQERSLPRRIVDVIWHTRNTRSHKSVAAVARVTMRELLTYLGFLIVLGIVALGMVSPTNFYFTKAMQDLFLHQEFSDVNQNTYLDMTNVDELWEFFEGPFLEGMYPTTFYNGDPIPPNELGFLLSENKLLGVPRIRQLVVTNNSCEVPDDFGTTIRECFSVYRSDDEDTGGISISKPIFPGTGNAFHFRETDAREYWGRLATYSSDGYFQDLSKSGTTAQSILASLKDNLWLRRGTRVLFVDFTVYNANVNLFCVVKLAIEFPAAGGVFPNYQFYTIKLIRYVSAFDYFVAACEILFVLFIAYFIVEEILELRHMGAWKYFMSPWQYIDLTIIVFALIAIAFNIYRSQEVDDKLQALVDDETQYAEFDHLAYWQTQYNYLVALALFMVWVKLFKFLSFSKTMTQLSRTLQKSANDLFGFAVMFFIVFFSFAQLGYLLFGATVKDFKSFGDSTFTLFRIILGDFDFASLENAHRILGPIYFVTFVFFVFFVLLNMFLAIINDSYSQVKFEIERNRSQFAVADYLHGGFNKLLNKLTMRRAEVQELRAAVKEADADHDGVINLDELRHTLQSRGKEREDIDALFTQYDADGDRVLDAKEQARLQTDLKNIEDELNAEEQGLTTVAANSRFAAVGGGVAPAEMKNLTRRVDRLENSIGSVVSKIDAILLKLEDLESQKHAQQQQVESILQQLDASAVSNEQLTAILRETFDAPVQGDGTALFPRVVTNEALVEVAKDEEKESQV